MAATVYSKRSRDLVEPVSSPPSCARRGPSSTPRPAWTRGSTPITRCGPDPRRHVRVPHRQRRRLEGRGQPPPSGDQSRAATCRASSVVPFLTTSIRWTTASRTPTARSSTDSDRWWSSAATRTSGRRAASSTRGSCAKRSARHQPALSLGGWANPHADAATQVGHLLADARHRRVLPDADRVAPQPRRRSSGFLDEADAARRLRCRACSACSTTGRANPEDAAGAERIPAGAGRGADARSSPRARRRGDLRPLDPRADAAPACGTSTSATCRSAAPRDAAAILDSASAGTSSLTASDQSPYRRRP